MSNLLDERIDRQVWVTVFVFHSTAPNTRSIANTIVQLIRSSTSGVIELTQPIRVAEGHCKTCRKRPGNLTREFMAEAVRDGNLVIAISRKMPLGNVAEAQAPAEESGVGKVLLVA